jgi:hypothetical protein
MVEYVSDMDKTFLLGEHCFAENVTRRELSATRQKEESFCIGEKMNDETCILARFNLEARHA